MKYYIIAGEASGDLHASKLMHELKLLDKNATFRFVGGDAMTNESNTQPFMHYKAINFIGFTSVIKNILFIIKKISVTKQDINSYKPDVVILVDFAGFNLNIAKYAKKKDIKVCYYILPKAWAWKASRALRVQKYTDLALSILPFEVDFYKKYGVKAIYVGNPVLDSINSYNFNPNFYKYFNSDREKLIALFPGSRKSEIKKHLNVFNALAQRFPTYQFVIAAQDNYCLELCNQEYLSSNIKIMLNCSYDIMKNAHAAIIKSGTSSLEASFLSLPHIVIYKTSFINYLIMRLLIKIKYVSLINLILGKEAVKEYLQTDFKIDKLSKALYKLLNDKEYIKEMSNDFAKLKKIMATESSSIVASKHIINLLS